MVAACRVRAGAKDKGKNVQRNRKLRLKMSAEDKQSVIDQLKSIVMSTKGGISLRKLACKVNHLTVPLTQIKINFIL